MLSDGCRSSICQILPTSPLLKIRGRQFSAGGARVNEPVGPAVMEITLRQCISISALSQQKTAPMHQSSSLAVDECILFNRGKNTQDLSRMQ